MNLRSKLLFGIGIALIVTFALVAAFSYFSMEQSYRMLEKQEAHRALESTTRAFDSDMEYTYSINRDYAAWSETYRFAQGQNPGWIDQNMGDDFFSRFDIDYVLVFNTTNQLVFAMGYNASSQTAEAVPEFLVDDIRNQSRAGSMADSTHGTYGVLDSPDGLFIISSHPVLMDNFVGPAAGSLHIVRRIDSQYLTHLTSRTGYSVSIFPAQDTRINSTLAGVASRITESSPIVVIPENEDIVSGYIHTTDLLNPGGLYVKVAEHRTIYHAGRDTIVTFLSGLFVAGIFIISFVLLFIDWIVLSRLNAIISTMRKNTENGNNPRKNGDRGQDELSRLALEIDPVFSQLAESRTGLKESEERYRTLIDQLPDYVIVHRDGVLLYVNPAAAARIGYNAQDLLGKPMLPFVVPEYHDAIRQAISRRMKGDVVQAYEMKLIAKDGTYRTVLANGAVITFEGKPASLNVLTDITSLKQAEEAIRCSNEELENRVRERTEDLTKSNEQLTAEIAARTLAEQEVKRSLQEKDLLLREIHHRVKNNLQIIASLLNLQSRYITDPHILESIKDSQSRVRAMALVHERIYRSHNIAEINLRDYLNYLTKQILQFYNIQQHQIGIIVTMDDILADIDTITPLGLIMNELVSNSLKHAFPEGRKGTISIECTLLDEGRIRIVYHDNGAGMPDGFDWKHTESLGLRLVNSLVDQLDGTIETGGGEGTMFLITIQKRRDTCPV